MAVETSFVQLPSSNKLNNPGIDMKTVFPMPLDLHYDRIFHWGNRD